MHKKSKDIQRAINYNRSMEYWFSSDQQLEKEAFAQAWGEWFFWEDREKMNEKDDDNG
jgi:hypothetical protein